MPPPPKSRRPKIVTALIETFGFSPLLASLTALFILMLGAAALLWVVLSAPPRSITIISGPPGSSFESRAQAYQKELAESGITLMSLDGASYDDGMTVTVVPAPERETTGAVLLNLSKLIPEMRIVFGVMFSTREITT
jgi:hypothetical protein